MPTRPILDTGSQEVVEAGTCERRQVADLIYGQGKKSYRRRRLIRVSQMMHLGTEPSLKGTLQGLDLSGKLNTPLLNG